MEQDDAAAQRDAQRVEIGAALRRRGVWQRLALVMVLHHPISHDGVSAVKCLAAPRFEPRPAVAYPTVPVTT